MPNMNPKKNPMPSQDPAVRRRNFDEVALGYTEAMAIDEAERCLNCKNMPCVSGCPVGIAIPSFIQKVKTGEFEEAYRIISESSSLPAVCGRVCPQETQCESKCVRGIKGEPVGIGRLERYVADRHNAGTQELPARVPSNGHRVAVIGSGPSGLTCAGDLARKGYEVTVFEALHTAGGVLVYGIPEFRLPKAIVSREIDALRAMGVDIEVNTVVGTPILTGTETMILPVSKVSVGFFSGGGEYGGAKPAKGPCPIAKSGGELAMEQEEKGYPFAGASIGGMTLTPLAFLSVTNGTVKVLPAQSNTTLDRAIELIPEAITTLEQAISGLCNKKGAEEAK